jgi:hypothetical protein
MASTSAPPLTLTSPQPAHTPVVEERLQYILDWNPQVLEAATIEQGGTTNTKTRPASFYDKHIDRNLILLHFQYHPDLAKEIASTVDKAITAAQTSGHKPPSPRNLLFPDQIAHLEAAEGTTVTRESPIAERYKAITANLCLRIASTLALHPRCPEWESLLKWTQTPNSAIVAIADGALQLNLEDEKAVGERLRQKTIYPYMDPEMLDTVQLVRRTFPDLAVWEVKSLTVGTDEVMTTLLDNASLRRRFPWVFCFCDGSTHKRDINIARRTRRGPDADETPWTLRPVEEEMTEVDSVFDVASQDLFPTFVKATLNPEGETNPPSSPRRKLLDNPPLSPLREVLSGDEDESGTISETWEGSESVAENVSSELSPEPGSSPQSYVTYPSEEIGHERSTPSKRKIADWRTAPDWFRTAPAVTADSFIQQVTAPLV